MGGGRYVHEDDLEGVPVVAGPLGAFYEKLSQLHLMKYCMAQPRNTVSGSTSILFLLFLLISSNIFFFIFAHISSYFLILIIIKVNISINYN
jgi:hypothetical protein